MARIMTIHQYHIQVSIVINIRCGDAAVCTVANPDGCRFNHGETVESAVVADNIQISVPVAGDYIDIAVAVIIRITGPLAGRAVVQRTGLERYEILRRGFW